MQPPKAKILIIDDDENFLKTTQDILQDAGYGSSILSDPMKAEEYIEKDKPDLIIIDIIMPLRSGFNILEDFESRNIYQDIPKIFLTALDDSNEKMVAHGLGVKAYIVKPFDPDDLISKIKECLGE